MSLPSERTGSAPAGPGPLAAAAAVGCGPAPCLHAPAAGPLYAPAEQHARHQQRLDRAYAKSARVLVPLAMLVVVLCQLDANNLAFAALTFNRDLGLTPTQYGLGSAAFFATFSACTVPSNLAMVRLGVRLWLGFLIIAWGVVACCFSLVHNFSTFVTLRLLLGACESGVSPAMWFHLSQFFPQERLTKPYALMAVGILIAAIIGAPIAAGLLAMEGQGGLRGWQWLFLVEGIPSVLLGLAVWALLPEGLSHAKWLTREEKDLVDADMVRSRLSSPPREMIPRNPLRLLAMAVRNPLVLYVCVGGLLIGTGGYTIIFFLPIMVHAVLTGQSLSQAQASAQPGPAQVLPTVLTAVPFAVAAVATGVLAHSSQRQQELYLHYGAAQVLSGVFFAVAPLMASASVAAGFVGLVLLVATYSAANGLTMPIVSRVSQGPAQVVGVPVYMTVATAGGMLGPPLTGALLQRTGGFSLSCLIIGAMLVACGVMFACLRWLEPRYHSGRAAAAGGGEEDEERGPLPRAVELAHAGSGPEASA